VKKLLGVAFLLAVASLALAPAAYAQRFGPPACATCITPNNPTPGVPGSAISYNAPNPPGFTAFNPPPSMGFTAFNPPPSYGTNSPSFRGNGGVSVSVGINTGFGRRGHYRSRGYGYGYGYGAPIVYPVYVPVEVEASPQPAPDVPSGNALDREMWSRAAEREDRGIERRDIASDSDPRNNDPRYGTHYLDSREPARAGSGSNEKTETAPAPKEDNGPSIILMLRDGTRVELGNYAIVGQNIFDLGSAPHHKKIPLADVDLAATQKANDAVGLDFKLPNR
jgi:hypothetical protein